MKKLFLSGLAVFLALALSAPTAIAAEKSPARARLIKMLKDARTTHPQVSLAEAKMLMATDPELLVIDVREPAEFKAGHVPGAIHIPRGLLEFKLIKREKNLDRPILIYCRSGARASFAGEKLTKLGYTNVKNMTGGYLAFAKAEKVN
jgi:rhodanese-related sulfurtransferase